MTDQTTTFAKNSMSDIKAYFSRGALPLKDGEFKEFWTSLTNEEKDEYRMMDLGKG